MFTINCLTLRQQQNVIIKEENRIKNEIKKKIGNVRHIAERLK